MTDHIFATRNLIIIENNQIIDVVRSGNDLLNYITSDKKYTAYMCYNNRDEEFKYLYNTYGELFDKDPIIILEKNCQFINDSFCSYPISEHDIYDKICYYDDLNACKAFIEKNTHLKQLCGTPLKNNSMEIIKYLCDSELELFVPSDFGDYGGIALDYLAINRGDTFTEQIIQNGLWCALVRKNLNGLKCIAKVMTDIHIRVVDMHISALTVANGCRAHYEYSPIIDPETIDYIRKTFDIVDIDKTNEMNEQLIKYIGQFQKGG